MSSQALNEFQKAHEELISDSAHAKIMGAFINLDSNAEDLISQEINERDPGEHLGGLEHFHAILYGIHLPMQNYLE